MIKLDGRDVFSERPDKTGIDAGLSKRFGPGVDERSTDAVALVLREDVDGIDFAGEIWVAGAFLSAGYIANDARIG